MKICQNSKCLFKCREIKKSTASLDAAMIWVSQGRMVEFVYNDEPIGLLVYGGKCRKFEELPNDVDYGVVIFCEEQNSYFLSMPDEIMGEMPE